MEFGCPRAGSAPAANPILNESNFNGSAEWNSATNNYATNRGIAWWFDIASTSLGLYGSHTNFPSSASPGPPDRGANFFLGGTASGWILQRIDLSDIAADINSPGVDYFLSGWFGGAAAQGDTASLAANFLDAAGAVIGSSLIGNVTAADRANITSLLQRHTNGVLPVGTRLVEFALTNRVVTGNNDGSADDLSFVLTLRPDPPFSILNYSNNLSGWRVEITTLTNRLYALERSADLESWTSVTAQTPGTGSSLALTDSSPPVTQAFYRVRSQRL
jgi:hypothetical protein